MKFVDKFLKLNCAPDVLYAAGKMTKASKEITESMSILKHIRTITLKNPMEYVLLDFCAGNALTSLLAVHSLPIKKAYAFDIKPRLENKENVNRFEYLKADISIPFKLPNLDNEEKIIIVASHSCGKLAERVIERYKILANLKKSVYLVLMPCCIGEFELPNIITKTLGKYLSWSYYLSLMVNGNIKVEKHCLSPCNAVIVANNEKR